MFNANDKIKLNPEIFPQDKLENKTFQAGSLNYPVLILDWECQVIDSFTDSYHGLMLKVNVLNDTRVDPTIEVYLKAEDCLISKAIKLKIDYTILGKMLKVQPLIDANREERAVLMKERTNLKRRQSVKEKEVMANWKLVTAVDKRFEEIKKDTSTVFVVKHSYLGEVQIDCKEDQIENRIRTLIRQKRAAAKKIEIVSKPVAQNTDIVYKKVGRVASEAGQIAKLSVDFAVKVINQPKKPSSATDNFVGIELECFSSKDIDAIKKAFIKAGLKSFVNVGTDGSIRPEGKRSNGMEIRVCIAEKDLAVVLPKVMKVLEDNDCAVNKSCGTHVHLDMRNRNPELAYSNLFKTQKLMLAIQSAERRKNEYCMPNTNPEEKLATFGQSARRSAINASAYTKHKTIEIRLHQGTVSYEDLKNWVNFLVTIVSLSDKLPQSIDNTKDLKVSGLVNEEVIASFSKREKKYA